jgi:serine protease Do
MRPSNFGIRLIAALALAFMVARGAPASEARNTPVVRAIDRAAPSVVNIHSERTKRERDSMFEAGALQKVNGMGTGVIFDERGYIITNHHVVAGVDSLRVTTNEGSTYAATVVSTDPTHDLAVIKIEASRPLPVMPLGTSSDLRLGETVVAIGNAFGYEHTATIGIISSLSRDVEVDQTQSYKNLLQTDAAINPGNSGGPLLNLDGEVVGINVAIRAGAQKIGFAIKIDDARRYVARILDIRKLSQTWHGLHTQDQRVGDERRLLVTAVDPESPAAAAGVAPGDLLRSVRQVNIADAVDLERALLNVRPGEPLEVVVERKQESMRLPMQLARYAGRGTAPAANGTVVARARIGSSDTTQAKSWTLLGLRLVKAEQAELDHVKDRYSGGMKVLDVRPDSPAARKGIRKGDILVGLHEWETRSLRDIDWIINKSNLVPGAQPLRFYVVRGREVLFGSINVRNVADGGATESAVR